MFPKSARSAPALLASACLVLLAGCGSSAAGTQAIPAPTAVSTPSAIQRTPHSGGAGASRSFVTPSGNISCLLTASPRTVSCAVADRTWKVPGGDRHWCGATALQGITMTRGDEPEFLCGTDVLVPHPDEVLRYGRTIHADGFTCWSRRSGVTCADGASDHFLVARGSYRLD